MVQRVAIHTRLKAGKEAEYERVHATIPPDLAERMRAAGVTNWRIWRSGRELFHEIEVVDYQAMRRALAEDPVNMAWQARMAELLEVEDDYGGVDEGLPLVWSFA